MATLSEVYLENNREAQLAVPIRFVLYQPKDGCGWGNQLRGLVLSFVFALCTKRVLVVDDFLITEHIMPPAGTDWSTRRWKKEIGKISDSRTMNLRLRPDAFDQAAWREYETVSMDSLFPETLVILNQGVSFIDALLRNPHHEPFLRTCGIDTSSKLSWLGTICGSLFARRTAKFDRSISRVSRRLNFPSRVDFGIQFRSFYDIGAPNLRYFDSFISGFREDLLRAWKSEAKPNIYALTDDPQATKKLTEALEDLGNIIAWPHQTIHTAEMNHGIGKYIERILVKIFGRRAIDFDLFLFLPSQWRPRPHTSVLAEWFLLGECEKIYSIFTSFAAFAAARTGNSSCLIRFDTENSKFELLRDETYLF